MSMSISKFIHEVSFSNTTVKYRLTKSILIWIDIFLYKPHVSVLSFSYTHSLVTTRSTFVDIYVSLLAIFSDGDSISLNPC